MTECRTNYCSIYDYDFQLDNLKIYNFIQKNDYELYYHITHIKDGIMAQYTKENLSVQLCHETNGRMHGKYILYYNAGSKNSYIHIKCNFSNGLLYGNLIVYEDHFNKHNIVYNASYKHGKKICVNYYQKFMSDWHELKIDLLTENIEK